MFGNNPTRKLARGDGSTLHVQEVFHTVQGEGPFTGHAATFIRLWGCHLRCWFCDTDFESSQNERTVSELVAQAKDGRGLAVLTGGEPMRQNIAPLCRALVEAGLRVQIETAGSFWFQQGPDVAELEGHLGTGRLSIVVSPKNTFVNPKLRGYAVGWKYIVDATLAADPATGLPLVNYQERGGTPHVLALPSKSVPRHRIYVQPMDTQVAARNKANELRCAQLALSHGYTVSLQTHKILGVP